MDTEKNRAPAAAATVKIVEALAGAEHPVGLAELSILTGLNKNMISRTLGVLIEAGWVVFQPETGRYSLSLQLFRLGSRALGHKTLLRCASPYLRELNDRTGECIQMAVLYDNSAVYIAQMEAQGVAGIRGQIGASYPLDTTAPGKVLKAFVLRDPGMENIRTQGFSVDNEEYGRGVVCIAAPVYDYSGEVIASIGISSLTVNYSLDELMKAYMPLLLAQTQKLSRELGYGQESISREVIL